MHSQPQPDSNRSIQLAFRSSIRRGTGRAHLLALQHASLDFSNEIIAACIRNDAYDGQCEPRRDAYLHGIIQAHGKRQDKIKRAVLKAIASESRDTWSLTQLFALSLRFARAGDERFRDAMVQRFHTRIIEGSDWVGAEEIMALDGIAGLRHVATVLGQALLDDPADWQDDAILDSFNALYPHTDARAELQRCADQSTPIAAFLSSINATQSRRESHAPEREPQNDLVQAIRSGGSIPRLQQRTWEQADVVRAAEALVQEQNPQQIAKFLWFFNHIPFPLQVSKLLAHARDKGRAWARIQHRALGALELLTADRVREFALQRMHGSRKPQDYAGLLVHNYRPGDATLLAQLAKQAKSQEVVEQLARCVIRIYTTNQDSESAAPLSILYDKLTCSVCRHRVVEAMSKNGVLPPAVREELPYDCNAKIRALAR